MTNEPIKNYLETIKSNKEYDAEFVEVLIKSYDDSEDGAIIAEKVIEIINKRYDKDKENKT